MQTKNVPQTLNIYIDFYGGKTKSVYICESVGLCAIRLSARTNLACYLTFILCVVHCGVCPEDDPIPSAQLGYRVLPVECVLLGE